MSAKYFHFTIGPVQGFVAQARRTRDFWAGSFILSWLSAVAMKAVMTQGGKIEFPKADLDYLSWLEGDGSGERPAQGSVPNRFKAEIENIAVFDAARVTKTVNEAWAALADKVFESDLKELASEATRDIWDRQVWNFWEMSWVIVNDKSNSAALDQRKNQRSHFMADEPGVKCMMMDGLQELSGVSGPLAPNGEMMREFWSSLRHQGRRGMKSDLRPDEQLCAIGFIKRRFCRYFDLVDKIMPGGWRLRGWKVDPGRPSVTYMAAVRWLQKVIEQANGLQAVEKKLWAFHDAAHALTGEYGEWSNEIYCISRAKPRKKWQALDGNVFFESMLENANIYEDQKRAGKVISALKNLLKSVDMPPPTPFYAVLMMDGDGLGAQMSIPEKQNDITTGLADFTKQVSGLVRQHNGFLIYAGGDDVLAVLPVEDALDCALSVRQCYESCFEGKNVTTSLSGAIEFAHVKMPLTKVLKDAHDLLDNVAKDGRGRDALAARIWKPGGKAVEWAMPWEKALEPDPGEPGQRRLALKRIADDLAKADELGRYSSRFFYKIREFFDVLNPADEGTEAVLDENEGVRLLAAEYYSSGLCEKIERSARMTHAESMVKPLLKQCRPRYRDASDPENIQYPKDKKVFADGALLARFLARKGVER